MDRTHDISLINYHLKDLATFGNLVTEAANAAFPKTQTSRYKEVHVLLLSWEEDSLGVIQEVLELQDVFRQTYFYDAEVWRIPSDHSYKALRKRLNTFLDDFEDKESLLIVYYGGHGYMNDDRQCIWSCTGASDSATVLWSGLQNSLEYAESDTLILLDCCAAASSISGTGSAVTEVIAACGFETWAPGVGEHSFTRSLIDELKYWGRDHTLSVATLHNKVLSRIKYWKPRFGTTGEHEHRKTPIYIVLANEGQRRSIELLPFRPQPCLAAELPAPVDEGSTASDSSSEHQSGSVTMDPDSSQSSLDQMWPDPNFHNPKVLVSIALEEDQLLNTDGWTEWIRSIPALVKYCHVEGIYKSGSTLLLITLPIAVWDLLPSDLAIRFLGFTYSWNLLDQPTAPNIVDVVEGSDANQVQNIGDRTDVRLRYVSDPVLRGMMEDPDDPLCYQDSDAARETPIASDTSYPSSGEKESRQIPPDYTRLNEKETNQFKETKTLGVVPLEIHKARDGPNLSDTEAEKYWGYLFTPNRYPAPLLEQLLYGIANYIIHQIAPLDTKSLAPRKLANFYFDVNSTIEPKILEGAESSMSRYYDMIYMHFFHIQTNRISRTGVSRPDLTPQGFVTWQTTQLMIEPRKHVPFLQAVLERFDIRNPVDGAPFPKKLPKATLPSEPVPGISEWSSSMFGLVMSRAFSNDAYIFCDNCGKNISVL